MSAKSTNKPSSASLSEVHQSVDVSAQKGWWRKLLAFIGPAYLISVGYMDPGNWATDIAGGSKYGYSLIWVLLMSNLIALLLQSLSARLGIVRGQDLAQASRHTYPKWINLYLYTLAEIAIAACDLAEVLGMAIGIKLLFGIPLFYGVIISVLDTFLLLFLLNFGIRKMEAFIIFLVGLVGFSFLTEMFIAHPNAAEVATGFIPGFPDQDALYIAIGIIGATVMPHNLYLHSSLVQTRKIGNKHQDIQRAIRFNFIDSVIALNLAFFVNAAILILAATVFFKNGMFHIAQIEDAHQLLSPLLGSTWAPILFAVALIAAGQSSTITGTLAGQIIMEGYLNLRIQPWVRRIITRLVAVIPSMAVIAFFGEAATGKLLILSQVILSMQLGFAIIPLIHFVSDKQLMGTFVIKKYIQVLSWISAAIIVGLNIKLVFEEISILCAQYPDWRLQLLLICVPILVFSFAVLAYITLMPLIKRPEKNHEIKGRATRLITHSPKRQFYRIAVAVDFSDADSVAIAQAVLQKHEHSTLLLLHVVESAGAFVMAEDLAQQRDHWHHQQLKSYEHQLQQSFYLVETHIGYGNPKKIIPELVKLHQADLLIMAAHGHTGIRDFLLGTTLNTVRHKVDIPVLIIDAK